MYFWLMFQIMFLYVLLSFACCHFARKYCSEDVEDSDSSDEEFVKAESELMEGVTAVEGGTIEIEEDFDDHFELA